MVFGFILSGTTLLVNAGLGWSRGAWWVWGLHTINATAWQVYVMQPGMESALGISALNIVTICVDIVSGIRAWRRRNEK